MFLLTHLKNKMSSDLCRTQVCRIEEYDAPVTAERSDMFAMRNVLQKYL